MTDETSGAEGAAATEDGGASVVVESTAAPAHTDSDDDYSERVRKRLARERRLRGDLERQLAAERRMREELAARLMDSDRTAVGYAEATVRGRLEQLQGELRAAYAVGDAERLIQLQTALADATADARQVDALKRRMPAQGEQQQPQQPARPQYSPATQAWIAKNRWFETDQEMRTTALQVHNKIATRFTPETPEYFAELDRRMKAAFPEGFDDDGEDDNEGAAEPTPEPVRRTAPASPARTVGGKEPAGGTRVRLTAEMMETARAMGMTPEKYAKRRAQLIKDGIIKA